jgi:copper transport protein
MKLRHVAAAAVVALLAAAPAWGHAGLTLSEPAAGAALGDTPTAIELTFSEPPQASLSSIKVLDANGRPRRVGRVERTPADPLSVTARVARLPRGVYTVVWRIVSAVDGHATSGSYAFGVGVVPTGGAATTGSTSPDASKLEMVSRWALLVGLALLIGAGVASVARFGGREGADVRLGAVAFVLAGGGALLLAEAQRRTAGTSAGALLRTPVGHSLIWRGLAIAGAGVALLVARRLTGPARRIAMGCAALAALYAGVVHVSAGHAASGPWPRGLSETLQSVHLAAAGVWIGGLAALLYGGAAAAAVKRFAIVAGACLLVVAGTGTARAVEELTSWRDLGTTWYGRLVLVKILLVVAIAALAARNPPWDAGRPLRRGPRIELVLAAGAFAAAALLGSLGPPIVTRLAVPLGLTVKGSDARSTVRVELTAASAEPGPNRFTVKAVDEKTDRPVPTGHITLRFRALDDPGVAPSSLVLSAEPDLSFAGSGANMVFDGRWGVTVLVPRPAGIVRVPLELDTRTPAQFVSIESAPGRAPKYTVEVGNLGFVRISPHPERPGPTRVYVNLYDIFGDVVRANHLVLTTAAGDGPASQQPVKAAGNRFIADAKLVHGRNTITVVTTTHFGVRLRAILLLDVKGS